MKRHVRIDLSRLIWRARHSTPSGIDRVEMAYARHFLCQKERPAHFIARLGALGARELGRQLLERALDKIEAAWDGSSEANGLSPIAPLVTRTRRLSDGGRAITIIPSHQNWHRKDWLERRRGSQGRLVLFLHDTIPCDYPEYARGGGAARHEMRMQNGLALADAIIVNSASTGTSLQRFMVPGARQPQIQVAPLGLKPLATSSDFSCPAEPYFVCLGTIEPRKNHLLLLHIWRRLAESATDPIPRLVIVGRRGWENENIIDLLDRSHAVSAHVTEYNALSDNDLATLLRGARALLMPSFAEGYGLPVNEALANGVPVIAGNLPVYAETAGDIPEYLDPLDGPGWTRAIVDYAQETSVRRTKQLQRLAGWRAPDWREHFQLIEGLLGQWDC